MNPSDKSTADRNLVALARAEKIKHYLDNKYATSAAQQSASIAAKDSEHAVGLQTLEAKMREMRIDERDKQRYRERYIKVEADALAAALCQVEPNGTKLLQNAYEEQTILGWL